MYSTIQRKTCKCGCGKMPSLGYNGYRFSCAPQEIKEKVGTKTAVARKNRNKRLAMGRKLHEVQDENNEKAERIKLDQWFKKIEMEHALPTVNGMGGGCACWECGAWIPLGYVRHATAHIMPKFFFRSIMTHPNNFLILGAGCGCHNRYDRSWEDASKMKVFKEAKERFLTFVNDIAIDEQRRIPNEILTQ